MGLLVLLLEFNQSVGRRRGRLCAETLTEVVESSIEAVRCEQLKHAIGLYRWFERLISVVREFLPRL
jgi:hypothetical protein